LVADAQKAVTQFVNAQHCKDVPDVRRALSCLEFVVRSAQNAVENGKMEKLS
jgi:hypothetical protein